MATKIIMPKLGMTMAEGVVAKWLKHDGDEVHAEEDVGVIMSKKITYKLKAPVGGIVRLIVREKETRPVNAVLAFITAPGEPLPEVEGETPATVAVPAMATVAAIAAAAPALAAARTGFVLASPSARRLAKEKGLDLGLVPGTGADGMVTEADVTRYLEQSAREEQVLATPAARKLAERRGLKLSDIPGSGPGGRVTEQDVLACIEAQTRPAAPAPAVAPAAQVVPFTGVRQMIAEAMVSSLHSMAQLTMFMEVDATELVKVREQVKADFDLTYTDLLVKAVATTLVAHPKLNATLIGDEIHQLEAIHIGVAVALPEGLIVPVVHDANKRTLQEIAQEVRRLATGARENTLTVDEVTGATFTITNMGQYGVDGFTPIINAPEAAILGVGRIADRVAPYNGECAFRKFMVLSLTIDHRLLDGAPGAEFLQALKQLLENPYRLLV